MRQRKQNTNLISPAQYFCLFSLFIRFYYILHGAYCRSSLMISFFVMLKVILIPSPVLVLCNYIHSLLFCRNKRAAYKYSRDRGAVASRWCWLATQISELDYKIRHFTDLRKHIKENKGVVTLEGQLPGSNSIANDDLDAESEVLAEGLAARVRPFVQSTFRKRKLVQTANLHLLSKKAGRPRWDRTFKISDQF